MNINKSPKDSPVCVFISIIMIIVFLLFSSKIVTCVPTGKNIHEIFMSNFVHIDTSHLISNIYALYSISRVEQEMGFKPFIHLLIFLLIVNTVAEFAVRLIWKDLPCSIGFSGVLFGLFTWELASKRKVDIEMLIAIVFMVLGPSLKGNNISLSGHVIGAVSGVVAGIVWNFIVNSENK
jgi:membrane associated rhomboid family serine protease